MVCYAIRVDLFDLRGITVEISTSLGSLGTGLRNGVADFVGSEINAPTTGKRTLR